MTEAKTKNPPVTLLGLFIALGVPILLGPAGLIKSIFPQPGVEGTLLRETVFWLLAILVLLLLKAEGASFSDIGFRRPRASTLLWGVVAFVASMAIQPLDQILLNAMHGSFPSQALSKFAGLPAWVLALIVVRAAIVEEILFRGYGISRMTALTGSRILGALLPGIAFMVAHMQAWGVTYAIAFVGPITVIMTALFLFRRDLGANMVAHFLTDAVSVSAAYLATHH